LTFAALCFLTFDDPAASDDAPKLVGLLVLHVDDMLAAGDPSSAKYQQAENQLRETFSFRTWQDDAQVLEYCGV